MIGHTCGGIFADFFVQGEPEVRSFSVMGIGILSCGVLALEYDLCEPQHFKRSGRHGLCAV